MYNQIFSKVEFLLLIIVITLIALSEEYNKYIIILVILGSFLLFKFTNNFLKYNTVACYLNDTLRHYVLLAFYLKIIIILLVPENTLGSLPRVSDDVFNNKIYEYTLVFFVGVSSALLSLFLVSRLPLKNSYSFTFVKLSKNTVFFVNLFYLFLKVYLVIQFDFAKPGVEPIKIPIPFVTGLLNVFCIHIILIILLVRFLRTKNFFDLSLLLLNIIIDVLSGYKFSIITTLIIILIFSIRNNNVNIILLVKNNIYKFIICVLLLFLYPILDLYSDLTAAGISIEPEMIIKFALSNDIKDTIILPFTEIIRRVNGLDTMILMKNYIDEGDISLINIFNNSANIIINKNMYGSNNNVISAAGATIFLIIYEASGFHGLFFITFILSLLLCILIISGSMFIKNDLLLYRIYMPYMCFEYMRFIFSSGDYINNINSLIFLIFSFVIINVFKNSKQK